VSPNDKLTQHPRALPLGDPSVCITISAPIDGSLSTMQRLTHLRRTGNYHSHLELEVFVFNMFIVVSFGNTFHKEGERKIRKNARKTQFMILGRSPHRKDLGGCAGQMCVRLNSAFGKKNVRGLWESNRRLRAWTL
jgi:hypothetical protein